MALAHAVRDRMLDRLIAAIETLADRTDVKVVAYLSAEFLMGPHLGNALANLGLTDAAREAVASVGQNLEDLLEQEEEPGLGNGGLGRLAACYMDSLSTLSVPAIGYGIRYEFGIFDQEIRDGWQVELTDKWLRFGNPWEIVRSDLTYPVMLGGRTEHVRDESGRLRVRWVPDRMVRGIAYDTPVPGYLAESTNLLRLWKAEAIETFDLGAFNKGDYYGAVNDKVESETISKVLVPERRARDRETASARAAVLLRVVFTAGHDSNPSRTGPPARKPFQQLGRADERHASDDCSRRTDATADRRTRARLGRGMARHAGDVRVHEPHAAGRGPRDLAPAHVREAASATPRDHLRDQSPLPGRCAPRVPG